MLLKYAEANAFKVNTSGAPNKFPKWGRRAKAAGPILGGAPAPVMCSASIRSVGLCTF